MPIFGARADMRMEINSPISPTRLVFSFTRQNKHLTGDRPLSRNYFRLLKTKLKISSFSRGPYIHLIFSCSQNSGQIHQKVVLGRKASLPHSISVKTSIRCSFLFFLLVFLFYFFLFALNESSRCMKRKKRSSIMK